jgi:hypothetical protein
MIKQCTKERDDSILLSKNLGYQSQLLFTYTNYTVQCGMPQQTNAATNSFYQLNQDSTTNTGFTTNADEYFQPT